MAQMLALGRGTTDTGQGRMHIDYASIKITLTTIFMLCGLNLRVALGDDWQNDVK